MPSMLMKNIIKFSQENCPCCNGFADVAVSLENYPLTEFFTDKESKDELTGFVDQNGRFCESCEHFFLENVLDPDFIYNKDNYVTSSVSSKGAVDCINELIQFIDKTIGDFDMSKSSIIDIGGNDSTLLKEYLGKCISLINIDPHAISDEENIILENRFLEKVDFEDYRGKDPIMYVSSHTFEHLENPFIILRNLATVIRDQDVLYLQFPSIEKLYMFNRYDQLCHQHINLFSLRSITKTMEKEGLFLNNYEYDNSHFGTIRLKFSRKDINKECHKNVSFEEIQKSFHNFQNFYKNLNNAIEKIFNKGQGFGAGLMVPTLSYHLPIINSLSHIIDENPARIGKKFINLHPPIVDSSYYDFSKPILITSISTKTAARAIFSKLCNLGFKDICLPTMGT